MKNNHTTGPWTVTFDGRSILSLSDKGTYVKLAETTTASFVDGTGRHEITEDDAKANAKLIAAAPEMFDALKAALALLIDPDAEAHHADEVEKKIIYALRKAKGE